MLATVLMPRIAYRSWIMDHVTMLLFQSSPERPKCIGPWHHQLASLVAGCVLIKLLELLAVIL